MVFVVTNSSKKANKRNISCFSLKKKTHFFKLLDLSKKKTRSASNFPKCGINKVKSYLINIFNIQVNVIRAKIFKKNKQYERRTDYRTKVVMSQQCQALTVSSIDLYDDSTHYLYKCQRETRATVWAKELTCTFKKLSSFFVYFT